MALDNSIISRGPEDEPLAGVVSMTIYVNTRSVVFATTKPEQLPPM